MTVEQKLRYVKFAKDLRCGNINDCLEEGDYIDIDRLKKCIESLTDSKKTCVIEYYGLDGNKYTYKEIGEKLGITPSSVKANIDRGIHYIRIFQLGKNKPIGNVKTKLQQCQRTIKKHQIAIADLRKIIDYISDENGNPKEAVDDISLQKLGFEDYGYIAKLLGVNDDIENIKDILDAICSQEEEQEQENEKQRRIRKEYFEGFEFSARTYNCLIRANITTVSQLVAKTEEDLMRGWGFGKKSLDEVKRKLQERGLQLGQKTSTQETSTSEEISSTSPKTYIDVLLARCNVGIEVCNAIISNLEKYQEELEQVSARYEQAKANYLERENIFDPNGLVPGVRKEKARKENDGEEKIYIDSEISVLNLSRDTCTPLYRANIYYIYELILKSEEELRRIKRYWK